MKTDYNREIEGRAIIKTPVRIRSDILIEGRIQKQRGFRYNASPKALIAQAMAYLSLDTADFGSPILPGEESRKQDALVKEEVRLYLESWVVPALERAYDKLNKTKPEPAQT